MSVGNGHGYPGSKETNMKLKIFKVVSATFSKYLRKTENLQHLIQNR